MPDLKTDFLIIGSGITGLFLANKLSNFGEVIIITKGSDFESSTNYAQGGIASVISKSDDFQGHIKDTLEAGAGLCDPEAVRILVNEGPDLVKELLNLGVPFDREEDGSLHLGKEGGHAAKRIVHVYDRTGKAIEETLLGVVRTKINVKILEYHSLVDLITPHHFQKQGLKCYGAYVLRLSDDKVISIQSRKTILTSGGAGQVYAFTTNPRVSTGDGLASAYRAGAKIRNMEFYQFHPTALYSTKEKTFLISEAIRGEGGILRTKTKDDFMKKYHPLKDLAPRDIVARAVDAEMKKSGEDFVYLDVTHIDSKILENRFPTIFEECLKRGINIAKELIPVVPAAHFMCGGVMTDLMGRTNIDNLYAAGEVSSTGVHGGNRLASNSLLECLVFSNRIALDIEKTYNYNEEIPKIPEWNKEGLSNTEEWILISHNFKEVKTIMSSYVGIVRSNLRLERALRRINLIKEEVIDYYNRTLLSNQLIELRNIVIVADLIIRSALLRKESRGLHFSTDYEEQRSPSREDTILQAF